MKPGYRFVLLTALVLGVLWLGLRGGPARAGAAPPRLTPSANAPSATALSAAATVMGSATPTGSATTTASATTPTGSAPPASSATPTQPAPTGAAETSLTTVPRGKGLPLAVRVAVQFVEIVGLDENEGTYTATLDLRLRWDDRRLSYPAEETPRGFKEFRGAEAEAQLTSLWTPNIALANMAGEPSYQLKGLRIFPDGRVELMQRTTAKFSAPFNVSRFPFDRQELAVELVSRRETAELLTLDFHEEDLLFAGSPQGLTLPSWTPRLMDLRRAPQTGWYGESYSKVVAALEVARQPEGYIAPIFVPLVAALLVPLLATWLNKTEDGDFQIEAFELANIIIGGLFAVIALNFTINSEYRSLASSDNPVSRLFGLNYLVLALTLLINMALFRFNLVKKVAGKYVQEQLYLYLIWALPLCAFGAAAAVVLAAAM